MVGAFSMGTPNVGDTDSALDADASTVDAATAGPTDAVAATVSVTAATVLNLTPGI